MNKDSRCYKGSTPESVAAPVHPILGRDCYIERENIRPPKEKVTGDPRVSRIGGPFISLPMSDSRSRSSWVPQGDIS